MTKQITIREYTSAPQVQKKMKEMLESPKKVSQFTTSVISIAGSDALLADAEPRSLFNACLMAASLDLPINKNLGFSHIIGYRNNKKGIVEAQFQLGARGFKELAQRSGRYQKMHEGEVREGEVKSRNRLTGEVEFDWIEDDAEREKTKVIGYFSYFKLDNGFESLVYWTVDKVTAHAKRFSQAYKSGYGPWKDDFDAMAKKTVMKNNLSKNGPLSVEMQTAITADQAVIKDDDKYDYIDGKDLAIEDVGADDDKKSAILDAHSSTDEPEKNQAPLEDTKKSNADKAKARYGKK